jgi:two-component system, OmpR family, phosphate regulon sensor histidine kinase PhoR
MSEARTAFVSSLVVLIVCDFAAVLIFGWPHATIVALGFCVYFLFRHMRGVSRLLKWAREPFGTPPPEASGNSVWDDVFASLTRRHRESTGQRQDLHMALDRFRLAAEALPDGVVILDESLQIEWMNREASLCLGLNITADIGTRILNLLREPDFDEYVNDPTRFERALEFRTQRNPGHTFDIQIRPFSAGRYLLLVRDTTQLTRMTTMRKEFVANVSHELKTPLTVTLGFLETLDDSPADIPAEERRRYIQMATEQAKRMQHLIDELLTLAALETDAPPKSEAVNLADLIKAVHMEASALSAGRHQITFEIDKTATLQGDQSELHSAMLNLAGNAVHYTPAGGQITMGWRTLDNGDGEFSICDNGIGIAESDIGRLTERFFRADRSHSRTGSLAGSSGGTGLGLSIVKQVVERHNGRLDIKSVLGQGSSFSIVFPSARVSICSG